MRIVDLNSFKCPQCGGTGTMVITTIRTNLDRMFGNTAAEIAICHDCGYAIDPMGRPVLAPEFAKMILMSIWSRRDPKPRTSTPGLQDVLNGKLGPINIKEDNPNARL